MKWRRHSGDVWVCSRRGSTLVVLRTIHWKSYGDRRGKLIGETWWWACRGHRIGHGIKESRVAAQKAAESEATRK